MASPSTSQPTSIDELEKAGVRYVRLYWVDFINFVRYRVIPLSHFKKLLAPAPRETVQGVKANPRSGIMLTKASFGLVYLNLAGGFGAAGEYLYVPDISTARLMPYLPGHASVLGWFEEKEAIRGPDGQDTFTAALCPRELLRKAVERAKAAHDVDFLMGFETEVIFLKSLDPLEAANDYGWSESAAIAAGSAEAKALEEIADALQGAGIELQMYHSEAAPGQFEIVTGPLAPLEACDALIATRECIMNVAAKHGMRATLAPRVYNYSCGSAAHTHISLKSGKLNAARKPAPGAPNVHLTEYEASFLAGLLENLPAIIAFTLPTPASYDRMLDGVWSGGTWASWGRDNRESPVRLCGASPSSYNFEIKCADGTSNPYLAAAAIIAGGMDGIERGAKLEIHGLTDLASKLSDAERKKFGVTQRLPLNIQEARSALKNSKVLTEAFGEYVIDTYLSVNETLGKMLEAGTAQEAMLRMIKTY